MEEGRNEMPDLGAFTWPEGRDTVTVPDSARDSVEVNAVAKTTGTTRGESNVGKTLADVEGKKSEEMNSVGKATETTGGLSDAARTGVDGAEADTKGKGVEMNSAMEMTRTTEGEGSQGENAFNKWVEFLKRRKSQLKQGTAVIAKATPSVRGSNEEKSRDTTKSFDERSDPLKVHVAIEFLTIIHLGPDHWEAVTKDVVPVPTEMEESYQVYWKSSTADIQSLLTLDVIFLACFLMYYLDVSRVRLGKVGNIFSEQPRRIIQELSVEILKAENQIPFMTIGNVYQLLYSRSAAQKQGGFISPNKILGKICMKFVTSNNFPSFHRPSFSGTTVVSQHVVAVGRGILPVGNDALLLEDQHDCRNLLHCQAEALWDAANPIKFKRLTITSYAWKGLTSMKSVWMDIRNDIIAQGSPGPLHTLLTFILRCLVMGLVFIARCVGLGIQLLACGSALLRRINSEENAEENSSERSEPALERSSSKSLASPVKDKPASRLQEPQSRLDLDGQNEAAFERDEEQGLSDTDERDPFIFSAAVSTAKELNQHGIIIKRQKEFFPRFQRFTFRPWRATLFLPEIGVIGKDTQDRWRYLLEFEDTWMDKTSIYDNPKIRPRVDNYVQGSNASPFRQNDDAIIQDVALWDELALTNAKRETCILPFVVDSKKGSSTPRKPFLSYLQFMDDLINTEDDVDLLFTGRHPVILTNNLGERKAVADLFNSMTKDYPNSRLSNPEWTELSKTIRDFHNSESRRVFVEFLDIYCGKPWLPISLLAATVLLVLTFVQTYYAVKG